MKPPSFDDMFGGKDKAATDEQMADFLGGFSKKPEHPMAKRIRELNAKLQQKK